VQIIEADAAVREVDPYVQVIALPELTVIRLQVAEALHIAVLRLLLESIIMVDRNDFATSRYH